MMDKRAALKAMGALAVSNIAGYTGAVQAQAAPYPVRPITFVAPYGAGNAADVIGRFIAQQLSALLEQPIVMDNRPGAGGVGAINQVATAAPNGYTLLMLGAGAAISQSLFKPAPFDLLKSFTPVAPLTAADVLVLVRKDSKLQKLDDFVREARKANSSMMVGVSLLGTTQHMSAELLKLAGKLNFTVVPYKTASAVNTALLAGEIDVAFELVTPVLAMLQADRVRALAIGSAKRSDLLPAVPTVAESGFPSFEVSAWGIVVVPANTPDAIVQRLNADIQTVMKQAAVVQRIKDSGQRPLLGTAAQTRELLASEIARWGHVITEAKVSLK